MINFKSRLKRIGTHHRQGTQPNFFVFSTPRSGSTWLVEMLATQGRFKIVNEPFNLRKPFVRENLGLDDWNALLELNNRPIIRSYLRTFIDGNDTDLRYRRETPFSQFWHPFTDRVIFKILFAGENDVNWFHSEFSSHIILLLRHPIPVALSRETLPRLRSFLATPYSDNFSSVQLRYAHDVIRAGDKLQIGVLDWCLKNAVPLRHAERHWTVLSYEQMVLQPDTVVSYLASRYSLPRPERMSQRVFTASRSTGLSNVASQDVLRDDEGIRQKRTWLTDKWRDRLSPGQERSAFETLEAFGIRFYVPERTLPPQEFLVG